MSSNTAMRQCRQHLDRVVAGHPDRALQACATKALRFVAAGEKPIGGKPEGWAAGIIYAMANRGQRPCGMPGFLNTDFEQFLGVSMSVIRRRAGQVERALEICNTSPVCNVCRKQNVINSDISDLRQPLARGTWGAWTRR